MKCHPCGQDNAAAPCSAPPAAVRWWPRPRLPTRLEPLAQPAMAPAVRRPRPTRVRRRLGRSRNRFAPPDAGRTSRHAGDPSAPLTDEEALAAVIGDASTVYYLDPFDRLERGQGGGWNWPAFLVTWYWMLYPQDVAAGADLLLRAVDPVLRPGRRVRHPGAARGAGAGDGARDLAGASSSCRRSWPTAGTTGTARRKIRDVRPAAARRTRCWRAWRPPAAPAPSPYRRGAGASCCRPRHPGRRRPAGLPDLHGQGQGRPRPCSMATEVANAVGKQLRADRRAARPGRRRPHRAAGAAHQSKYVDGVDLDSASGTLTVQIEVSAPPADGPIQLVPSSDNNHHLSWTCTVGPVKTSRYVPASCSVPGGGALASPPRHAPASRRVAAPRVRPSAPAPRAGTCPPPASPPSPRPRWRRCRARTPPCRRP